MLRHTIAGQPVHEVTSREETRDGHTYIILEAHLRYHGVLPYEYQLAEPEGAGEEPSEEPAEADDQPVRRPRGRPRKNPPVASGA